MVFGVTPQGFVTKRLADCKLEWEDDLKGIFGDSINLDPRKPFGQLVGICSEREALLWELLEAIYQNRYPKWATGLSLDGVVSLNGVRRQRGTKSTAEFRAFGEQGTPIPANSIISVSGNSSAKFKTLDEIVLGAGVNEQQKVNFSGVPTTGTFTLLYLSEATAAINFNDNAAAVESKLEALTSITEVTVTGNFTSGFTITFTGADGEKPHPMLAIGANTLSTDGLTLNVNVTFQELVAGSLPFADGEAEALVIGSTVALAGTLSVIETPISGWESVTNLQDAEVGLDQELDADLKLRREKQIAKAGAGTLDAIRGKLLDLEPVTSAVVYQNRSDETVNGLPPHSVHAIVEGGSDALVAKTLFEAVGGGIETYGNVTYDHIDSQGNTQQMRFSRPTDVDIYLIADIEVDSAVWPDNGDVLLEQALLDFGNAMQTGDDVIVYPKVIRVFDNDNLYPGMLDITIKIGTAPAPTLDNNISISGTSKANWDSSRITINVTEV